MRDFTTLNISPITSCAESVPNHYETPIIDAYDDDLALGISECYLERERLQVGELITSGNFGEVHRGELRMRDGTMWEVAVKSLISK